MANQETSKLSIVIQGVGVLLIIVGFIWAINYSIDLIVKEYSSEEVVVEEVTKEVEQSDIVTVDFVECKLKCMTSDGVTVVVRFTVLKGYSISVSKSHYYGIINELPAEILYKKLIQFKFLGTQIHQVHFEGEFDRLTRVDKKREAQIQL